MSSSLIGDSSTPLHIAVEGNIGAGKTKLAVKLGKRFNITPLLEEAANPFLADFYQNPSNYALATQLHFLFARNRVNERLREGSLFSKRYISDFLIDKELLFASTNLNEREYQLYLQVYQSLSVDQVKPDLVIYLQTDTAACLRSLSSDQQKLISYDYLDSMNEAYTRFFHFYDQAPLMIVNASEIDLENDEEFDAFCQTLASHSHGRNYYNPMPLAI